MSIIQITVPTANNPAAPAARASIWSNPLRVGATGMGRGAAAAGRAWEGGAAEAATARDAGCGTGAGMAEGAPVGPPGGRVGNLMVGAAEGLGGKLMRTVSFLG